MKAVIELKNLIAPSFYNIHHDLKKSNHTHYWLKGGRGSTKSSFVSLEIILGMMKDPNANAVVLRKVGQTLQGSVFEQLQWAIQVLGVESYWVSKLNPLEMKYVNGNKIVFRGADKPKKIKSTKFSKGYCKYIWYEEVDEFGGMEEIRTINQSLLRGGDDFVVFYSYNPPLSQRNWVNEETTLYQRKDRLIHHSTYLTVPKEWLGIPFLEESEHLKNTNLKAYQHEMLGIPVGTGSNVFEFLELKEIPDKQIEQFDRIYMGIDFGWYPDPFAFVRLHYDRARNTIYIFDEIYQNRLPNQNAAALIKKKGYTDYYITCDSAEPKSIYDLKDNGLPVKAAVKGAGSVEYGMKRLQSIHIVIDPKRCPHAAKEFTEYEYDIDKNGDVMSGYPDENNHCIDATRYALERVFLKRGF